MRGMQQELLAFRRFRRAAVLVGALQIPDRRNVATLDLESEAVVCLDLDTQRGRDLAWTT